MVSAQLSSYVGLGHVRISDLRDRNPSVQHLAPEHTLHHWVTSIADSFTKKPTVSQSKGEDARTQPLALNGNPPALQRDPLDEMESPAMPAAANSNVEASSLTTKEMEHLKGLTLSIL